MSDDDELIWIEIYEIHKGRKTNPQGGNIRLRDKHWIDNASYEDLLAKWRHTPSGAIILTGITGLYYQMVMGDKRGRLSSDDRVAISKRVG